MNQFLSEVVAQVLIFVTCWLDEGPVWLATCFKCSFGVCSFSLWLGRNIVCPLVYCSDNPNGWWESKSRYWLMCGFPSSMSTAWFRNDDVFYMVSSLVNLMFLSSEMICSVKIHLTHLSSRYLSQWLCVVPLKDLKALFYHFLHLELGYNGWQWGIHCTSMLLPVKTLVVLEIGGGKAEV